MDFSRLGRGDIVAAAGGLLLFLSLFLPWFSVSARDGETSAAPATESCTGFETFNLFSPDHPRLDFCWWRRVAPWILVWIVVRGHDAVLAAGRGHDDRRARSPRR